jgi:uncharacterized protein
MKEQKSFDVVSAVAGELALPERGVGAVVRLLSEGATVPFIARYRKEATGALDEVQIRDIEERRAYLTELEERRATVLKSIEEQGKLTDELKAKILGAKTKTALEDLYLPYKPKRRTRATIAREKGLEPLALRILEQPDEGDPAAEAGALVNPEEDLDDAQTVLKWAREIVAEAVAEEADVRAMVRDELANKGVLRTEAAAPEKEERTKFEDYYDHSEPLADVPSHRYLAIRRGETEGVLRARVEVDTEPLISRIERMMNLDTSSPFCEELRISIADAYKRKIEPSVETDVRVEAKIRSDREAVKVFAQNLENLLLAPPLGAKPVIGIDPGLRTGCKCAAVDATGKFLENITIFPSRGDRAAEEASDQLLKLVRKHQPVAVAVGNGTGGRETEAFARSTLKKASISDVMVVSVNEAGASVYSASDVARQEFPDLDVSVRGAISIARRLQDPLAELVKIDPKSIGVGQYQHDVHQPLLQTKLHQVIETCVNKVGVELNTASASLLSYVSGLGPTLAKRIVDHRDTNGPFEKRHALLNVSRLGPKTFEQAAGFLRVYESPQPLDRSAVHPERYALVEKMASDIGVELSQLVGNGKLVSTIDVSRYVTDEVGKPTLEDIIEELSRPGRDPRETFEPPRFREDVTELSHLEAGMQLEGVVTNVTAFGAFVDVGVHQDGLVHVSKLADRFVKDPHEVVKVGDRIKVRVLDVDLERKRISLSARSDEPGGRGSRQAKNSGGRAGGRRQDGGARAGSPKPGRRKGKRKSGDRKPSRFTNNPFADLLSKMDS